MLTPDAVVAYARLGMPSFEATGAPVRLSGGLLNYVWRVPGRPSSVVVKAAPPYVAAAPEIGLDPSRVFFEARALRLLGPGGALHGVGTPSARPPHLLHFDRQRHVVVMEDVGEALDLGARLAAGESLASLGHALGAFIGRLHAQSHGRPALARCFSNDAVQRTRMEVQYEALGAACRQAGVPQADAVAARLEAVGRRFLRPGRCLIMGDLWPRSLLVTDDGLRVIDWEFAHYGDPAQDLGHLAAHLWMLAHRIPEARPAAQDTWGAFEDAYQAETKHADGLTDAGVEAAAAVHCGAEILARTLGAFRDGYLYHDLDLSDAPLQEAVAHATAVVLGVSR